MLPSEKRGIGGRAPRRRPRKGRGLPPLLPVLQRPLARQRARGPAAPYPRGTWPCARPLQRWSRRARRRPRAGGRPGRGISMTRKGKRFLSRGLLLLLLLAPDPGHGWKRCCCCFGLCLFRHHLLHQARCFFLLVLLLLLLVLMPVFLFLELVKDSEREFLVGVERGVSSSSLVKSIENRKASFRIRHQNRFRAGNSRDRSTRRQREHHEITRTVLPLLPPAGAPPPRPARASGSIGF